MIRPVRLEDARALGEIYNYYIARTVVSFEERTLDARDMEERIQTVSASFPWLVWEEDGEALGYAYVNTFKERFAYRFSVEDTIYLKRGCEGRGIGKKLIAAILNEVKKMDVHVVVSCITMPNERSVGLHEKFGFIKIAHFHEIGFKFDRWLDVGYWELTL
ncbi:MAG: GNAT family N-acetyltransferase [Treponema sp.]|jgi:phosphinothricin acetyltransferase|nr:GNAT family N-acetyltransferase [Treponema sp.]